jgi:hypothetical protein
MRDRITPADSKESQNGICKLLRPPTPKACDPTAQKSVGKRLSLNRLDGYSRPTSYGYPAYSYYGYPAYSYSYGYPAYGYYGARRYAYARSYGYAGRSYAYAPGRAAARHVAYARGRYR